MASLIPLRQEAPAQLTKAQTKFWVLLQEPENRALTVPELCKKAGYKSCSPWYQAMRDKAFRANVEALRGVKHRRYVIYPTNAVPLAENPDAEWLEDIIDIRRFVGEYPKHVSAGGFLLDFSCITNGKLKELVKRYFRARIGFWEPLTFRTVWKHMRLFFIALGETYPGVDTFASLTRVMIEPLLTRSTWTDQRGRMHPISTEQKFRMVSNLESMFLYMQRHAWEGAPTQTLLYEEDRPKRIRRNPRPIPQRVLEQLRMHLHLLSPYAHNLVEILSVAGLRAEDAMHLSEDCLEYDAAGDPRLCWYNHKMKRDGRPLPVTTTVVDAIKRQKELVKDIPDCFGKRYLFRTKRGLYQFDAFCRHLNTVAKQVPILGEDGQVYHFKPHQFRHTVGTQMLNNGMGIADVMAYLDHQSAEMTLQYAMITDDTLKQKFKQLVLSGQAAGGVALKALKEQLEQGDERELDWVVSNLRRLSLPWGYCLHHAKATKCPYGQNVCFTKDNGPCHKLVTTPDHAPVIVATMEDLKNSRRIAEEKGWEMYANDLGDQIKGMEHVLSELNLPADQRQKNRGGKK